jgi:PhzF family phenazine biosynthesis protein
MDLPLFQIDAFSGRVFGGNPAAVCPLGHWLPDETLQAIAAENNLSETAFFVPRGGDYDLRWFTPATEVDLCGHATLAAGALILERLALDRDSVRFHTRSGVLEVRREGEHFVMDFLSRPAAVVPPDARVAEALGCVPAALLRGERDYLAVFADETEVRALAPNQGRLMALDRLGMIVTAQGRNVDFVSRFFAPRMGVNEDPVTGSAHCTLTPYWADRLKKSTLTARQISARGGEMVCELRGDRVTMKGRAAFYLEGTIHL